MAGGQWRQPVHDLADPEAHERGLRTSEWAALLASSDRFDAALLVDGLGAALLSAVRLEMVRRAAVEAIRLRTDHLRSADAPAMLVDDADAAADRLTNTLARIDARQGEGAEPAAAAIAALARQEYAAGCAAAQKIIKPAEVLELALTSLRLPHHDIEMSIRLILDRVPVTDAIKAGGILGERHWWPGPLRELALSEVRAGRALGPLVECLDGLGFSNLSPMQQRAALRLLNSPTNPYGLDPNAIAAAVRGVALDHSDKLVADLWRNAES